jgi:hypothetical protein
MEPFTSITEFPQVYGLRLLLRNRTPGVRWDTRDLYEGLFLTSELPDSVDLLEAHLCAKNLHQFCAVKITG